MTIAAQLTAITTLDSGGFELGARKATKASADMATAVERDAKRMGAGLAQAGSGVNGFSRSVASSLGNVAQQVQDVAVQFQMGTNAAIIFAQQGPQILSGFGPIPAVIGTVAAVATVAAQSFGLFGAEAKKVPDFLGGMSEALSAAEVNTKSFISEVENAGAALLDLMGKLADLQRTATEDSVKSAVSTVTGGFEKRALEEARRQAEKVRPEGDLNVPFSNVQRFGAMRSGPAVMAARQQGRDVEQQLMRAVSEGDVDTVSRLIGDNNLATPDTAQALNDIISATASVKNLKMRQKALEEAEKAKRENRAAGPVAANALGVEYRGPDSSGPSIKDQIAKDLQDAIQAQEQIATALRKKQDEALRNQANANREKERLDKERETAEKRVSDEAERNAERRQELIQGLEIEADESRRLAAAQLEGADAYARVTREIEVQKAVRQLGAGATEAEKQATAELTRELQNLEIQRKRDNALRQAAADRQRLIAEGKMTPIGGQAPPPVVNTEDIDRALGLGKAAETHAETYTDAWKTALEDLQGVFTDTFEQLFSGQLDSAKDFADQLKSIMARSAANLVSGALFSGQGGRSGSGALGGLAGLLGGAAPRADYRTMSQADAQRRMAMGPFAAQQPWQSPGMPAASWQAMMPRMAGMGALGLAGIGGMLGGAPGQFSVGGLMSTAGTGMMMGRGLGLTYGAGGASMLAGSLAGRMGGGGLMGAGMGALTGAGIGFMSGGPFGALAGGLLGGFGGFLGGGGKQARNRAAFSFNPATGGSWQDSSPGPDDPNRQASMQLVKELQQLTSALRSAGVNFRSGNISSSVSRTQTADEAMQSVLKQIRELAVGGSVPVSKALKNSQATTAEGLMGDIKFAQEFEVMIRLITPFQQKMRDLNAQFAQAGIKARELGLNEGALAKARERARVELLAQREAEANAIRAQTGIIGAFEARLRDLQEAFRQAGLSAASLGINVENLAAAQQRAMENLAQERENAANALRAQMGIIDPVETQIRQTDANVYWGVDSARDLGIDPEEIKKAGERQKAEIRRQAKEEEAARRQGEADRKRQLRMEALSIREQLGIINQWDAALAQLNETVKDAKRRSDELGISEKELNAARKKAANDILRSRISEADAVKVSLGVFTEYEGMIQDVSNSYADAKANLEKYWLSQKDLDAARARSLADIEQRRKTEAASMRVQLGIIGDFAAQQAALTDLFYQAGRQAKDLKLSESELTSARQKALANLEAERKAAADSLRGQTGIIGPWEAQRKELEESFRQAALVAKDLGVSETDLASARARALAALDHSRQVEADGIRANLGIIGPWAAKLKELDEALYQASQNAKELGISEAELASARTRLTAELQHQRQVEADGIRAQTGIIGPWAAQLKQLEELFYQARQNAADLGISEADLTSARNRALGDLERQRKAEADSLRGSLGIIGPWEAQLRELESMFAQASRDAAELGISEAELSSARIRALEGLRQQRQAEGVMMRVQLGIMGEYAGRFASLDETFRQAALVAADLGIGEAELNAARAKARIDLEHQRNAERDAILAETGVIGTFEASMRRLEETFYQASRRAAELGINEADLNEARIRAIDNLKKQRDEQLRQIENQLQAGGEQLRGFVAQLVDPLKAALSPQGIYSGIMAPQQAANDNMRQFRETLASARADDVGAIQALPAMAAAAVEAARRFGGSGVEFQKMFREIEEGLKSVLGTQLGRQEEIEDETPEVIRRTAQQQIDAMREEFARLREQMEGLRRDLRLRSAA